MNRNQKIIIGIIIVIILVVGGVLIWRNTTNGGMKIKNFSSYFNGVPNSEKVEIEDSLAKTVELNLGENQKLTSKDVAIVRAETVNNEYVEIGNYYYGTFVVDIESLKQSYYIQFEWSKEKNNLDLSSYNVVITCVPDYYKIYDTPCVSFYEQQNPEINSLPLPYYGKLASGELFNINSSYYEDGLEYLQISVCAAKREDNEVVDTVNNWLADYSLNLDDLEYLIYYNTCD